MIITPRGFLIHNMHKIWIDDESNGLRFGQKNSAYLTAVKKLIPLAASESPAFETLFSLFSAATYLRTATLNLYLSSVLMVKLVETAAVFVMAA